MSERLDLMDIIDVCLYFLYDSLFPAQSNLLLALSFGFACRYGTDCFVYLTRLGNTREPLPI